MIAHLAAAMAAAVLAATPIPGRVQTAPQARWLAECSGWPVTPADIIAADGELVELRVRNARAVALVYKFPWLAWMSATRIGERVTGWWVYSVESPAAVRTIAERAGRCRWLGSWGDAWSTMTAAQKAWLASRVTVCGEATVCAEGGTGCRTVTEWPGMWEVDRPARITVTRRDGLGPGAVGAGSPCSHIQMPE